MDYYEVDKLIEESYNWEKNKRIIKDGIINNHFYAESKVKILWILWEPYDDGGWDEWNWDSRKWINAEPDTFTHQTWRNIAKIAFKIFSDLGLEDMPNKVNALRYISYINVIKYPGEHRSQNVHLRLKNAYSTHSKALIEQITSFRPDVIIGGNSLYLFIENYGLTYKEGNSLIQMDRKYWQKNSQLFIDSKHPQALSNSQCDEIATLVINWKKNSR